MPGYSPNHLAHCLFHSVFNLKQRTPLAFQRSRFSNSPMSCPIPPCPQNQCPLTQNLHQARLCHRTFLVRHPALSCNMPMSICAHVRWSRVHPKEARSPPQAILELPILDLVCLQVLDTAKVRYGMVVECGEFPLALESEQASLQQCCIANLAMWTEPFEPSS